ncbi:MAG TPA: TonB-dependent receptor [Xanthomonadaceae bacterium]|jgi:outer membrane receptor protein involved in Fe transport
MTLRNAILLAIPLLCPVAAHAADPDQPTLLDRIEVTSDKIPTTIARGTDTVTVVDGNTLRAQGATDLAGAMRLVAGVEAPAGGDNGPASSVPALWGLREFDAFLLVVDGVPSGGAFNPALQAVDLANVERIEVLRGAAPVSFGATSFVGVIQVIHYAAGQGPMRGEVHVGTFGSGGGALAVPVNDGHDGGFASSLLVDADRHRVEEDRTGFERAHALYRLRGDVGGGTLGFDLDASVVNQDPGSPHPLAGTVLDPRMPVDANVNPSDAKLDETRLQAAFDYTHDTGLGDWITRFSLAHTRGLNTRGFLRQDFADDGITHNADGFRQQRHTDEAYFDSHVVTTFSPRSSLAWGMDYLYGYGRQNSDNNEYAVFADGHGAPVSTSLHDDEFTLLTDRRNFAGLYADWRFDVTSIWRLNAGVRFNHTEETRFGQATDNTVDPPDTEAFTSTHSSDRWAGALGTSVQVWKSGKDEFDLYANYRNTFKPAAIDFGPDVEGGILNPETAHSVEFGFRGTAIDGRLEWDASTFRMHFSNLVVPEEVDGEPGIANAGSELFRGVEFESSLQIAGDLKLQASAAWHDARFLDDVQLDEDGGIVDLKGNQLELSPHHLGGLGLTWTPAQGLNGYLIGNYVGARFLDKLNTARVGGYGTLDAGIGYRHDAWELRLDGSNLTDRRDPVAESEFGDSSFYLLPGRSVMASFNWTFGKGTQSP